MGDAWGTLEACDAGYGQQIWYQTSTEPSQSKPASSQREASHSNAAAKCVD